MKYFFELGRQPDISTAEIQAVFALLHINTSSATHQSNTNLMVETKTPINCSELMQRLGGTIKISEQITPGDTIIQTIVEHVQFTNPQGKIHFSVSGKDGERIALEVKKQLKHLGRSVRYIEIKNSATIIHNNLVEKQSDFTILNDEVFVTRAIQDIEAFSKRDYGRPGSDNVSGMLPPKLARVIINLAQVNSDATILDPFCGSGTILTEALSMSFTNLTGSDISEKAVSDTRRNIDWLKSSPNFQSSNLSILNLELLLSNATELDKKLPQNSIDAIVSEPYMGKPLKGNETRQQLLAQADELKQLYINSFRSFSNVLKPNSVIVFLIPRFKLKNEWITIDCTDEIKEIGFKIWTFSSSPAKGELEGVSPLLYHRPNQFVGREIWRFKKS
jgi:tRNA G10  N-methylase Trm11